MLRKKQFEMFIKNMAGGNKMVKLQRGEKGFLEYRKKRHFIKIFLSIGAGGLIFLLGLLLNKMEATNVFTVLAILMVLPMARAIVGVVVLFPYHGVSNQRYDIVRKKITNDMTLFTDLVITSTEKSMNLDFLVETQGSVIALLGKKGQKEKEIESYLSKGIHNYCSDYKVRVYHDEKIFLRELDKLSKKEVNEEEQKNVLAYITSLIVE